MFDRVANASCPSQRSRRRLGPASITRLSPGPRPGRQRSNCSGYATIVIVRRVPGPSHGEAPRRDHLRERAFQLREKGYTYALIEKTLAIPYLQAKELGREYDVRHGRPRRIIRTLAGEILGTGPTSIPVRDLRNDTGRILRQVEKGRSFLITVSGHEVAELRPAASRSVFVPSLVVENIIREAPLDRAFAAEIKAALNQRVNEL